MHCSDWKYRKIKCPPINDTGHWVLTDWNNGEVYECGDIAPLLRKQIELCTQGHALTMEFKTW